MTKLPFYAEQIIRQLEDEDDADDSQERPSWAQREPYLSRLVALLSVDAREVAAFGKLRRRGLLEFFAPSKRKRGERHHDPDLLVYAVDDAKRIKKIWMSSGKRTQRRDDSVTIEVLAAERHRRQEGHRERGYPHGTIQVSWCTVDKLDIHDDDLEEWAKRAKVDLRELKEWVDCVHAELHELAGEIRKKSQHRSGTTGADRYREAKQPVTRRGKRAKLRTK